MNTKVLELRDEGTFIPLLCVNMNHDVLLTTTERTDAQRYLLRRCGYPCDGKPNIAITKLGAHGDPCSNDPYFWGGRTMPVAHIYIIDHWDRLMDGDVVDVQFILGETAAPKVSERQTVQV